MPGAVANPIDWRAAVGPAWVEVDLDAIADNVRMIGALLPEGCRLLAVVKANAYGHGAVEVAHAAISAGAAGLGVSTVPEGLALRAAGITAPILVFTPPRSQDINPALQADLTITVVSIDHARALADAAARRSIPAVAHVKCDTGMGRYGFDDGELGAATEGLAALSGLIRFEGIYTHFARGADIAVTQRQLERFLRVVDAAERAGLHFSIRHAAASSAMLALPESRLDMVRIGTLLYGDRPVSGNAPGLKRAFALKVQPAQVRELRAGSTVGYGAETTLQRPAQVAVLPVGFADGFDMTPAGPYRRPLVLLRTLARALLSALGLRRLLGAAVGEVRMGDRPVRVLGRVGMQQVVVDCTGVSPEAMLRPATIHVRPTVVGAHLARVYMRDGVAVRAATVLGSFPTSLAQAASGERQSGV